MKKLTVSVVIVIIILCSFCLTGCYVHGRGVHGHHGGRYFWGGMAAGAIAGAIVAPLLYAPRDYNSGYNTYNHAPVCRDRVVRRGYYVRDYYGNRFYTPPMVVRECR